MNAKQIAKTAIPATGIAPSEVDAIRQELQEMILELLKNQRTCCYDNWVELGKSRFTRYGAKKAAAAILEAPEPE